MRLLNRLLCLIRGHEYRLIGRPTEWSMHMGCNRCDAEWGWTRATELMHGTAFMLPWRHVASFYAEAGYSPAAPNAKEPR